MGHAQSGLVGTDTVKRRDRDRDRGGLGSGRSGALLFPPRLPPSRRRHTRDPEPAKQSSDDSGQQIGQHALIASDKCDEFPDNSVAEDEEDITLLLRSPRIPPIPHSQPGSATNAARHALLSRVRSVIASSSPGDGAQKMSVSSYEDEPPPACPPLYHGLLLELASVGEGHAMPHQPSTSATSKKSSKRDRQMSPAQSITHAANKLYAHLSALRRRMKSGSERQKQMAEKVTAAIEEVMRAHDMDEIEEGEAEPAKQQPTVEQGTVTSPSKLPMSRSSTGVVAVTPSSSPVSTLLHTVSLRAFVSTALVLIASMQQQDPRVLVHILSVARHALMQLPGPSSLSSIASTRSSGNRKSTAAVTEQDIQPIRSLRPILSFFGELIARVDEMDEAEREKVMSAPTASISPFDDMLQSLGLIPADTQQQLTGSSQQQQHTPARALPPSVARKRSKALTPSSSSPSALANPPPALTPALVRAQCIEVSIAWSVLRGSFPELLQWMAFLIQTDCTPLDNQQQQQHSQSQGESSSSSMLRATISEDGSRALTPTYDLTPFIQLLTPYQHDPDSHLQETTNQLRQAVRSMFAAEREQALRAQRARANREIKRRMKLIRREGDGASGDGRATNTRRNNGRNGTAPSARRSSSSGSDSEEEEEEEKSEVKSDDEDPDPSVFASACSEEDYGTDEEKEERDEDGLDRSESPSSASDSDSGSDDEEDDDDDDEDSDLSSLSPRSRARARSRSRSSSSSSSHASSDSIRDVGEGNIQNLHGLMYLAGFFETAEVEAQMDAKEDAVIQATLGEIQKNEKEAEMERMRRDREMMMDGAAGEASGRRAHAIRQPHSFHLQPHRMLQEFGLTLNDDESEHSTTSNRDQVSSTTNRHPVSASILCFFLAAHLDRLSARLASLLSTSTHATIEESMSTAVDDEDDDGKRASRTSNQRLTSREKRKLKRAMKIASKGPTFRVAKPADADTIDPLVFCCNETTFENLMSMINMLLPIYFSGPTAARPALPLSDYMAYMYTLLAMLRLLGRHLCAIQLLRTAQSSQRNVKQYLTSTMAGRIKTLLWSLLSSQQTSSSSSLGSPSSPSPSNPEYDAASTLVTSGVRSVVQSILSDLSDVLEESTQSAHSNDASSSEGSDEDGASQQGRSQTSNKLFIAADIIGRWTEEEGKQQQTTLPHSGETSLVSTTASVSSLSSSLFPTLISCFLSSSSPSFLPSVSELIEALLPTSCALSFPFQPFVERLCRVLPKPNTKQSAANKKKKRVVEEAVDGDEEEEEEETDSSDEEIDESEIDGFERERMKQAEEAENDDPLALDSNLPLSKQFSILLHEDDDMDRSSAPSSSTHPTPSPGVDSSVHRQASCIKVEQQRARTVLDRMFELLRMSAQYARDHPHRPPQHRHLMDPSANDLEKKESSVSVSATNNPNLIASTLDASSSSSAIDLFNRQSNPFSLTLPGSSTAAVVAPSTTSATSPATVVVASDPSLAPWLPSLLAFFNAFQSLLLDRAERTIHIAHRVEQERQEAMKKSSSGPTHPSLSLTEASLASHEATSPSTLAGFGSGGVAYRFQPAATVEVASERHIDGREEKEREEKQQEEKVQEEDQPKSATDSSSSESTSASIASHEILTTVEVMKQYICEVLNLISTPSSPSTPAPTGVAGAVNNDDSDHDMMSISPLIYFVRVTKHRQPGERFDDDDDGGDDLFINKLPKFVEVFELSSFSFHIVQQIVYPLLLSLLHLSRLPAMPIIASLISPLHVTFQQLYDRWIALVDRNHHILHDAGMDDQAADVLPSHIAHHRAHDSKSDNQQEKKSGNETTSMTPTIWFTTVFLPLLIHIQGCLSRQLLCALPLTDEKKFDRQHRDLQPLRLHGRSKYKEEKEMEAASKSMMADTTDTDEAAKIMHQRIAEWTDETKLLQGGLKSAVLMAAKHANDPRNQQQQQQQRGDMSLRHLQQLVESGVERGDAVMIEFKYRFQAILPWMTADGMSDAAQRTLPSQPISAAAAAHPSTPISTRSTSSSSASSSALHARLAEQDAFLRSYFDHAPALTWFTSMLSAIPTRGANGSIVRPPRLQRSIVEIANKASQLYMCVLLRHLRRLHLCVREQRMYNDRQQQRQTAATAAAAGEENGNSDSSTPVQPTQYHFHVPPVQLTQLWSKSLEIQSLFAKCKGAGGNVQQLYDTIRERATFLCFECELIDESQAAHLLRRLDSGYRPLSKMMGASAPTSPTFAASSSSPIVSPASSTSATTLSPLLLTPGDAAPAAAFRHSLSTESLTSQSPSTVATSDQLPSAVTTTPQLKRTPSRWIRARALIRLLLHTLGAVARLKKRLTARKQMAAAATLAASAAAATSASQLHVDHNPLLSVSFRHLEAEQQITQAAYIFLTQDYDTMLASKKEKKDDETSSNDQASKPSFNSSFLPQLRARMMEQATRSLWRCLGLFLFDRTTHYLIDSAQIGQDEWRHPPPHRHVPSAEQQQHSSSSVESSPPSTASLLFVNTPRSLLAFSLLHELLLHFRSMSIARPWSAGPAINPACAPSLAVQFDATVRRLLAAFMRLRPSHPYYSLLLTRLFFVIDSLPEHGDNKQPVPDPLRRRQALLVATDEDGKPSLSSPSAALGWDQWRIMAQVVEGFVISPWSDVPRQPTKWLVPVSTGAKDASTSSASLSLSSASASLLSPTTLPTPTSSLHLISSPHIASSPLRWNSWLLYRLIAYRAAELYANLVVEAELVAQQRAEIGSRKKQQAIIMAGSTNNKQHQQQQQPSHHVTSTKDATTMLLAEADAHPSRIIVANVLRFVYNQLRTTQQKRRVCLSELERLTELKQQAHTHANKDDDATEPSQEIGFAVCNSCFFPSNALYAATCGACGSVDLSQRLIGGRWVHSKQKKQKKPKPLSVSRRPSHNKASTIDGNKDEAPDASQYLDHSGSASGASSDGSEGEEKKKAENDAVDEDSNIPTSAAMDEAKRAEERSEMSDTEEESSSEEEDDDDDDMPADDDGLEGGMESDSSMSSDDDFPPSQPPVTLRHASTSSARSGRSVASGTSTASKKLGDKLSVSEVQSILRHAPTRLLPGVYSGKLDEYGEPVPIRLDFSRVEVDEDGFTLDLRGIAYRQEITSSLFTGSGSLRTDAFVLNSEMANLGYRARIKPRTTPLGQVIQGTWHASYDSSLCGDFELKLDMKSVRRCGTALLAVKDSSAGAGHQQKKKHAGHSTRDMVNFVHSCTLLSCPTNGIWFDTSFPLNPLVFLTTENLSKFPLDIQLEFQQEQLTVLTLYLHQYLWLLLRLLQMGEAIIQLALRVAQECKSDENESPDAEHGSWTKMMRDMVMEDHSTASSSTDTDTDTNPAVSKPSIKAQVGPSEYSSWLTKILSLRLLRILLPLSTPTDVARTLAPTHPPPAQPSNTEQSSTPTQTPAPSSSPSLYLHDLIDYCLSVVGSESMRPLETNSHTECMANNDRLQHYIDTFGQVSGQKVGKNKWKTTEGEADARAHAIQAVQVDFLKRQQSVAEECSSLLRILMMSSTKENMDQAGMETEEEEEEDLDDEEEDDTFSSIPSSGTSNGPSLAQQWKVFMFEHLLNHVKRAPHMLHDLAASASKLASGLIHPRLTTLSPPLVRVFGALSVLGGSIPVLREGSLVHVHKALDVQEAGREVIVRTVAHAVQSSSRAASEEETEEREENGTAGSTGGTGTATPATQPHVAILMSFIYDVLQDDDEDESDVKKDDESERKPELIADVQRVNDGARFEVEATCLSVVGDVAVPRLIHTRTAPNHQLLTLSSQYIDALGALLTLTPVSIMPPQSQLQLLLHQLHRRVLLVLPHFLTNRDRVSYFMSSSKAQAAAAQQQHQSTSTAAAHVANVSLRSIVVPPDLQQAVLGQSKENGGDGSTTATKADGGSGLDATAATVTRQDWDGFLNALDRCMPPLSNEQQKGAAGKKRASLREQTEAELHAAGFVRTRASNVTTDGTAPSTSAASLSQTDTQIPASGSLIVAGADPNAVMSAAANGWRPLVSARELRRYHVGRVHQPPAAAGSIAAPFSALRPPPVKVAPWMEQKNGTCTEYAPGCWRLTSQDNFAHYAPEWLLLTSQKWYWVCVIEREQVHQIGVADPDFRGREMKGNTYYGVGDDDHSWCYDGSRQCLYHGVDAKSQTFAKNYTWKSGDHIGVGIDINAETGMGKLSYWANGQPLGVAFSDIDCKRGIFPAVSVDSPGQLSLILNPEHFGSSPLPTGYKLLVAPALDPAKPLVTYPAQAYLWNEAELEREIDTETRLKAAAMRERRKQHEEKKEQEEKEMEEKEEEKNEQTNDVNSITAPSSSSTSSHLQNSPSVRINNLIHPSHPASLTLNRSSSNLFQTTIPFPDRTIDQLLEWSADNEKGKEKEEIALDKLDPGLTISFPCAPSPSISADSDTLPPLFSHPHVELCQLSVGGESMIKVWCAADCSELSVTCKQMDGSDKVSTINISNAINRARPSTLLRSSSTHLSRQNSKQKQSSSKKISRQSSASTTTTTTSSASSPHTSDLMFPFRPPTSSVTPLTALHTVGAVPLALATSSTATNNAHDSLAALLNLLPNRPPSQQGQGPQSQSQSQSQAHSLPLTPSPSALLAALSNLRATTPSVGRMNVIDHMMRETRERQQQNQNQSPNQNQQTAGNEHRAARPNGPQPQPQSNQTNHTTPSQSTANAPDIDSDDVDGTSALHEMYLVIEPAKGEQVEQLRMYVNNTLVCTIPCTLLARQIDAATKSSSTNSIDVSLHLPSASDAAGHPALAAALAEVPPSLPSLEVGIWTHALSSQQLQRLYDGGLCHVFEDVVEVRRQKRTVVDLDFNDNDGNKLPAGATYAKPRQDKPSNKEDTSSSSSASSSSSSSHPSDGLTLPSCTPIFIAAPSAVASASASGPSKPEPSSKEAVGGVTTYTVQLCFKLLRLPTAPIASGDDGGDGKNGKDGKNKNEDEDSEPKKPEPPRAAAATTTQSRADAEARSTFSFFDDEDDDDGGLGLFMDNAEAEACAVRKDAASMDVTNHVKLIHPDPRTNKQPGYDGFLALLPDGRLRLVDMTKAEPSEIKLEADGETMYYVALVKSEKELSVWVNGQRVLYVDLMDLTLMVRNVWNMSREGVAIMDFIHDQPSSDMEPFISLKHVRVNNFACTVQQLLPTAPLLQMHQISVPLCGYSNTFLDEAAVTLANIQKLALHMRTDDAEVEKGGVDDGDGDEKELNNVPRRKLVLAQCDNRRNPHQHSYGTKVSVIDHRHPVEFLGSVPYPGGGWGCDVCGGGGSSSDPVYHCDTCSWDAHPICIHPTLTEEVLHNPHKHTDRSQHECLAHPECKVVYLRRIENPAYYNGKFRCNVCGVISAPPVYHCDRHQWDCHPWCLEVQSVDDLNSIGEMDANINVNSIATAASIRGRPPPLNLSLLARYMEIHATRFAHLARIRLMEHRAERIAHMHPALKKDKILRWMFALEQRKEEAEKGRSGVGGVKNGSKVQASSSESKDDHDANGALVSQLLRDLYQLISSDPSNVASSTDVDFEVQTEFQPSFLADFVHLPMPHAAATPATNTSSSPSSDSLPSVAPSLDDWYGAAMSTRNTMIIGSGQRIAEDELTDPATGLTYTQTALLHGTPLQDKHGWTNQPANVTNNTPSTPRLPKLFDFPQHKRSNMDLTQYFALRYSTECSLIVLHARELIVHALRVWNNDSKNNTSSSSSQSKRSAAMPIASRQSNVLMAPVREEMSNGDGDGDGPAADEDELPPTTRPSFSSASSPSVTRTSSTQGGLPSLVRTVSVVAASSSISFPFAAFGSIAFLPRLLRVLEQQSGGGTLVSEGGISSSVDGRNDASEQMQHTIRSIVIGELFAVEQALFSELVQRHRRTGVVSITHLSTDSHAPSFDSSVGPTPYLLDLFQRRAPICAQLVKETFGLLIQAITRSDVNAQTDGLSPAAAAGSSTLATDSTSASSSSSSNASLSLVSPSFIIFICRLFLDRLVKMRDQESRMRMRNKVMLQQHHVDGTSMMDKSVDSDPMLLSKRAALEAITSLCFPPPFVNSLLSVAILHPSNTVRITLLRLYMRMLPFIPLSVQQYSFICQAYLGVSEYLRQYRSEEHCGIPHHPTRVHFTLMHKLILDLYHVATGRFTQMHGRQQQSTWQHHNILTIPVPREPFSSFEAPMLTRFRILLQIMSVLTSDLDADDVDDVDDVVVGGEEGENASSNSSSSSTPSAIPFSSAPGFEDSFMDAVEKVVMDDQKRTDTLNVLLCKQLRLHAPAHAHSFYFDLSLYLNALLQRYESSLDGGNKTLKSFQDYIRAISATMVKGKDGRLEFLDEAMKPTTLPSSSSASASSASSSPTPRRIKEYDDELESRYPSLSNLTVHEFLVHSTILIQFNRWLQPLIVNMWDLTAAAAAVTNTTSHAQHGVGLLADVQSSSGSHSPFALRPSPYMLLHTSACVNRLIRCKPFLLSNIKHALLGVSMNLSTSWRAPTVQLDTFRATRAESGNLSLGNVRKTIFGQMFRSLYPTCHVVFRSTTNNRPFNVSYVGFHASDAGGPYRQSMQEVCSELQSDRLPLFVPVPNAKSGTGGHRDCWVPRPFFTRPPPFHRGALTPQQQRLYQVRRQLYRFVGCLLGLAIRTKYLLPLHLPPIIWKMLLQEEVTLATVEEIDILSVSALQDMTREGAKREKTGKMDDTATAASSSSSSSSSSNDDTSSSSYVFDSLMSELRFDVTAADGSLYDLLPGGRNLSLNSSNWRDYVSLLKQFRLHEYDAEVAEMRHGLTSVIPPAFLSLLTWRELRMLVVGSGVPDMELLQRMTTVGHELKNTPTIGYFWNVLKNRLSPEQQAAFLTFVWGRSTLPTREKDFERKMNVQLLRDKNPDSQLPVSHTCFFGIDLPMYTSEDILYNKLVYAITHCTSIDGDAAMQHRSGSTRDEDEDADSEDMWGHM